MRPSAGITIGVDLAAQRAETAACVLSWHEERAKIGALEAGLTDDDLVRLVEDHDPDKLAIDAPFGWPRAKSSYVIPVPTCTEDRRTVAFRSVTCRLHRSRPCRHRRSRVCGAAG